uniref:Amino acid transporter transmembrane domain-containing protein n=1 Tax=Heliothis virescens TaxID=7102 RepID=A0A2A4J8U1_HELVI
MGTTGQSITLANSIIGVGILAMPFCFQQCGVLLATLILLFMGLVSRLCCHFLLKSALLARRRNFEFLAFHVFGQAGKIAVEVGIIGFLMGTCIAYFVVVGDLGPQIIAKMFNINQSDILRTSIMVIVSLVCVLPLGLLRNVDSLSNVSAATIAFYFCLVMKVIFEAAGVMLTSDWNQRVEMWRPAGLLQCVPIFSMALFCQTQLFEIFESLPTLSLEKMNIVTKNAINICTAVYFTLGIFGYVAFASRDISGNILMSLSPTMASDVIKLGFVMSLAFSFPLIIFPCRASLYSFLYKKVHSSHHDHIINHSIPETTFRCITVAIVACSLFISLLIPNIELVLGLVGSTIGVLICVVFPAACFVNVTFKNTNERVLAKGVLVLGLVIMVLGTYANLQAAESSIEKYDDKYTQERIDKIVEDFFENRDKDDVYLKPPPENNPHKEPLNAMEIKKDVRKDSEVQPPNPVPPESQSNEKIPQPKKIIKTEEKIIPKPEIKEAIDKVSETHPRNLKTKLESKLANGVSNGEAQKTNEVKPQSNEDKIDMIKQQKLIETIKQHGEEQKELIKEQKEILDEILKTKKELQQNKNEAEGAIEAKKIAVESIKQIADMAIKSIGGVSEKPDVKDEVKADRLEKLTNDAVQEIAKKAVETIEAIQEIKEKPEQPIAPQNNLPNAQANVQAPNIPAQNVPAQNVQPAIPVNPQVIQGANAPIKPKDETPNNVAPNVNPQVNGAAVNQNGAIVQNNVNNVNQQPKQELKPVINEVAKENAQVPNNQPKVPENAQNQPKVDNVNKPVLKSEADVEKPHSHSPDEPQSYKQGEDTQAKVPENKVVQNVPLPIVNELANNQMKVNKKPAAKQRNNEDIKVNIPPKVQNNGARPNLQNVPPPNSNLQQIVNQAHARQKREVVDCTEKVPSKPEDKTICRNMKKDSEEILKSVDLNEVALPKSLPLDVNVLHHISRALKSFDKDER